MNTQTGTVTAQLLQVPLDDITPHPNNPRRSTGQIGDLAASIEQMGVLEPLIVAHWPEQLRRPKNAGDFVLIAGARRVAAARKAGLDEVPVLVRTDLVTLAEQVSAMLQENLHRSDLSPIEESGGYQLLLGLDLSQAEIAKRVARPKKVVAERLRLQKLPARVQQDVHTHQVTLTDALALADFADDQEALADLTVALGTREWGVRLEHHRRVRKHTRERAAALRAAHKAGISVLGGWPTTADPQSVMDEEPSTWPFARVSDLTASAGEHASSCRGHAIVDGATGLEEICTTPGEHTAELRGEDEPNDDTDTENGTRATPAAPSAPAEETPAQKADRETREQLSVAATVRRAHVRESLDTFTEDQARSVILDRLLVEFGHQYTGVVGRDLLGLDDDADPDAVLARIHRRARSLTLPALILLDRASQARTIEHWLTIPRLWADEHNPSILVWQRFLNDVLGYRWSDVEREHLPAGFFDPAPADDSEAAS